MKIQCPNCERILVVADGAAGRDAQCPACGQVMPTPQLPRPPVAKPVLPAQDCPACGRRVPGEATVCMFCRVVLASGQRLPESEADFEPEDPPAEGADILKRDWRRTIKVAVGVGCLGPVLLFLGVVLWKCRVIGPAIRPGDSFARVVKGHVAGPQGPGDYPQEFPAVPGAVRDFAGPEIMHRTARRRPRILITENPAWHYQLRDGTAPAEVKKRGVLSVEVVPLRVQLKPGSRFVQQVTRLAKAKKGARYPGAVFRTLEVRGYVSHAGRRTCALLEVSAEEGCVPLPGGRVVYVDLGREVVTRIESQGAALWVKPPKDLIDGRAFVAREAAHHKKQWVEKD